MPDPSEPPEHIEHPSHRRTGGKDDQEELVEDLAPGPDTPVIQTTNRKDIERSWFLAVFLGLLMLTIVIDLAGSALLSPGAWAQMKPEVTDVRNYMFQVTGVIIGFYFGTTVRRGRN
jgi:hypothetical protein